ERIRNYESINEENLNGWYTGSGMTYLYMDDLTHYCDAFWPTVDSFRLAGTTSDGYTKNSETNEESWVGGTVLNGLYGTTGMSFNKSNIYQGKKSWFTFDDEVVALGAGITGASDKHLLTTIENRRLSSNGKNDFSVNGVKQSSELGLDQVHSSVKWAHLAGDESRDSDIGYYFPDEPTLQSIRESRTGSWKDINGREQTPDKSMSRNYLNLTVDHGEKVADEQYSYVLLPTKNEEETAKYVKNPHVEILANSSQIQAVQENKLGIIAVNFWEAGRVSFIQSNQPAAIMAQEDGQQLVISIADPTQLQDKLVIGIAKDDLRIVESAENISVIQTSPSLLIEVDVSDGLGNSHQLTLECKR
ncbi:MAG TPA: polysaccharide lyase family 8 super-sandwich domain-containing protein, partial [Atopostipes sp.]|nr:polysaccharide lyase family 8 super-sandwich domain-containing protein [Atopostipes sp.]